MINKCFLIGDFYFQLTYPDKIQPPKHFLLFENTDADRMLDYHYKIFLTDIFPTPEGTCIAKRPDLMVYQNGHLEMRYIGIKGTPGYYACCKEINPCQAYIYLNPNRIQNLNIDPVFTSLFAFERRMIVREALLLHCAYIEYRHKAILFSAPSETGKTTQANLWEKYRHTQTINGDRALLRYTQGEWFAEGWPVCGTSEVCQNQSMPIEAIVMLSQGKEDNIRRLGAGEAFKEIYSQITINSWNREAVCRTMTRIDQLIASVPVFHLQCTISEKAVNVLEQALNGL